ncbi:thiol reductant ABC exporter subunit CydD [Devosia pacifica]|uniref:Thiol reductant ABC exporter subunit CydD n=1 Tax=Devosia pacifica TaxID=1335967 RepID=A0A918S1C2_9HYPH|nr:thiol reductant ABC exporter subunit CydD [Devosia pacifica]GHA18634.1 thiol reductant ABC exporter subunit CydD [Devosia pacifica]
MRQSTSNPDQAVRTQMKSLQRNGGLPLAIALAAPIGAGIALVFQAYCLAQVLGRTIEGGEPIEAVMPLIAVAAGLWMLRGAIAALGDYAGTIGAERIKRRFRTRLFARLLDRPASLASKPATGAVTGSLVDQVDALTAYFANYLPAMIAATILPLAFAIAVMPTDWVVGLLFLFTAPLIPVFMALAGWGAQAATNRQADAFLRLSGHFADRLRGLLTLKLFGRADHATNEVYAASEELRQRTNRVLAIAFLSSAILEFFAALGVAGVALYVGLTYLGFIGVNPGMTLSAGLFALLMAPEVYAPLRQLATHYHDRAAAKSALMEIDKQLGAAPEETTRRALSTATPTRQPGAVDVRDLTIRNETGSAILDQLELSLRPGEHLAVMGESGIGKSTLLRAISGLLPTAGHIELDGCPVRDLPDNERARRIVVIGQRPSLFKASIADNIRFARPAARREDILEAAWKAGIMEFAKELPEGLDAMVGEGGAGMSGGQAQRIGLARLFLTDPDLVLLDEPTAHLDAGTEMRCLDEILAFCAERTLILTTHNAEIAKRIGRTERLAAGRLFAAVGSVNQRKPHKGAA